MSDLALTGIAQRGVSPSAAERAAAHPLFEADVLFGADAYDELHADWQRLTERQDGAILFQTPALMRAWADHFVGGRSGDLTTVVVRHAAHVVLIWPLFVSKRGLVRAACSAGAPISQYDEVLIDRDYDGRAAIDAALEALADRVRPDLICLERVRADSALRAALRSAEPLSWAEGAPYTDLSDGMEGVKTQQKTRVARQQRKRLRAIGRKGQIDFQLASDAVEAEAWVTEALALKRNWLRDTGRVSRAFMEPATGHCLVELAGRLVGAHAAPRMIVSRLTLDGRTAAIEAGFCHHGTYHLYLGAFAPEFAKLGPGNVLTEKVLEWCVTNGVKRYDMLAPRSRNKREWQSNEVGIVDFALPTTLRGKLYAALVMKRLAPALRNAFYALPPRTRTVIATMTLRM